MLGLVLMVVVDAGNVQEQDGAKLVLERVAMIHLMVRRLARPSTAAPP
ncbi:MAG: hypothetical protein JNM70_01295 [Anaerolineae bacterium]|nr:hypothetical protein [Anaerolineae bacterium]